MLSLSAWIQVAGAVQLAIGLANLPLAIRLQYRRNLAGASEIVRQVFYVHAAYIVLVVLGFAALSLLFPTDLASGQPLGWFLSTFLAIFWLCGCRSSSSTTRLRSDGKTGSPTLSSPWPLPFLRLFLA